MCSARLTRNTIALNSWIVYIPPNPTKQTSLIIKPIIPKGPQRPHLRISSPWNNVKAGWSQSALAREYPEGHFEAEVVEDMAKMGHI